MRHTSSVRPVLVQWLVSSRKQSSGTEHWEEGCTVTRRLSVLWLWCWAGGCCRLAGQGVLCGELSSCILFG